MPDVSTFISSLKEKKIVFNEDKEIYRSIEDKINFHNVIALYQISQVFKNSNIRKPPILLIERCFPVISESQKILDLDYKYIAKIGSSSYLNIHSELEVFNAVILWMGNSKERKKFAKHLLLKIRLTLLSVPALKFITEKISSFIDNLAFIKEIIDEKSKGFHRRNLKSVSRFCDQDKFNIIVCGGSKNKNGKAVRDVYSIKANNQNNVISFPQLEEGRKWSKVVCIKGEVFAFGGIGNNFKRMMSIEKYSIDNKSWKVVGYMPDKYKSFCVCSFMGNAYVLGGKAQERSVASCFKFKAADYSMNKIAEMETARERSACAVFEGKIVVSGGSNFGRPLSTVEAYDHVANEWTNMPYMVEERCRHKSVAIKNKLYMFGGFTKASEVYDSTCEKFVSLKYPDKWFSYFNFHYPLAVISIGKKLIVFQKTTSTSLIYDVENDTWSEEPCEVSRNLSSFSCVKVPQY